MTGVYLLTDKGNIQGKFDQNKYNKLNFWQRLKFKFSYKYRCEFYSPINCIIINPIDSDITNELTEKDFIIYNSSGEIVNNPKVISCKNGYTIEF